MECAKSSALYQFLEMSFSLTRFMTCGSCRTGQRKTAKATQGPPTYVAPLQLHFDTWLTLPCRQEPEEDDSDEDMSNENDEDTSEDEDDGYDDFKGGCDPEVERMYRG